MYWANNKKLCSCCRECTEQIPVQFAQIYGTDCPGGSNDSLVLQTAAYVPGGMIAKKSNHTKPVKPGGKIKYGVRLLTTKRGEVIGNLGLQITLPPYVYLRHIAAKPRNMPRPTILGNATVGTTIRLTQITVTYKKPVKVRLAARVSKTAPYGTPLTITAATFTPGLFGEPTCLEYGPNTTVS